jgi:hypothetical protein
MIGRPDRFRVAVRGGLAIDKAFVIHVGEFSLRHDHLAAARRAASGSKPLSRNAAARASI